MAAPTFVLEIAFANNPLDASMTWTDVTTWVREWSIRRGRQFELDREEAGTLQFTLEDDDRRFDPSNTSSPYYPNLLPMRPVRATVMHNGTPYRRFFGYIEKWPQSWSGGGNPAITIVASSATDPFKLLAGKFLRSPYAEEILSDFPDLYWRFADVGGGLVDESGNGRDGFTVNGSFTQDAAVLDGSGALALDGTGYGIITRYTFATDFEIEFWIAWTGTTYSVVAESGNTSGESFLRVAVDGAGKIDVSVSGWYTLGAHAVTANPFNDGDWHLVQIEWVDATSTVKVYVDNVLEDTDAIGASVQLPAAPLVLGNSVLATSPFTGALDEFAIYPGILSAGRRAAHLAAQSLRAGELSGARVAYILDRVGWPAAARSIDVGQTTMAGAGLEDASALEQLLRVADSEGGTFFFSGAGNAVFRDRWDRSLPPNDVPQVTFGDGGGSEVEYEALDLSLDEEHVYNDVVMSTPTTSVRVTDDVSAAHYGPRSYEAEVDVGTAAELTDRANFALTSYKDPHVRCEQIKFGTVMPDAEWTALLARELGDRCRIMRRPPVGSAIQVDVFVEAMDESGAGTAYGIQLQLSPAVAYQFWVLGTSQLGVDTRLGF